MKELGYLTGNFKFVRPEHNEGISKKSGKAYDFCSVTLADDVESLDFDMDKRIMPQAEQFDKGDIVKVTFECGKNFGRSTFKVVALEYAEETVEV